jgi:monoamine oxidase
MKLSESKRVIVAGAGLAGLVAAYELSKLGHEVRILEAATTPGGRVRTLRSPFADDLHADTGAMFLPSNHPLPLKYASEFDLPVEPVAPGETQHLFFVAGERIVVGSATTVDWPDALELNEDEQGLLPAQLAQKYLAPLLGNLGDPESVNWPPTELLTLDAVTFGDLLRSRGASQGAVTLLGVNFFNLIGDGVESYSALFELRDEFLERANTRSNLIVGGNDLLPRAFAAALKDRIWYGSEVQEISQDDKGVRVVTRSAGDTKSWYGDYLVCALPFPVVRGIEVTPAFSVLKQRAIQELPYTSVIRIFLQMREEFWLKEGLSGTAFTDLPIMSVYPMFNQDGPRGILSCYVAGPNARMISAMSEDGRIEFSLDQMEKFYPQVRHFYEAGSAVCWSSDPRVCGGYLYSRPGQMKTFQRVISAPEGRVHFAGEHTSPWPGWMQGALQSGCRCANEIAQAGLES